MSSRVPFCVYGASGFTGQFVALAFAKSLKIDESTTGPCVILSGRSETKLIKVREFIARELGIRSHGSNPPLAEQLPIVVADVQDPTALGQMCKQAEVVVSCVGPYRLYGEPVVAACVENGASYVDICGEPEFIEEMELKYGDQAKAAGVVVVSSCGFDSVPAELCVLHGLERLPEGAVPLSVETVIELAVPDGGKMAGGINYATYESLVLGFASNAGGGLGKVRKALSKKRRFARVPLDPRTPKLKFHSSQFGTYDDRVGSHVMPFPGADASVVKRSQLLLAEQREKNDGMGLTSPTQYAAYAKLASGARPKLFMYGALFGCMVSMGWGRKQLLKNPKFFTNGMVAEKNASPSDENRKIQILMTAFVKAASADKVLDTPETGKFKADIHTKMTLTINDPGYMGTGYMACTMARLVFDRTNNGERDALKGVITPATVMRGTDIVSKLADIGIKFTYAKV